MCKCFSPIIVFFYYFFPDPDGILSLFPTYTVKKGAAMSLLYDFLCTANHFLWNGPLLFFLLGTHLFFTIRLGFIQKHLKKTFHFSKESNQSQSFRSLSTALAATLGTGNIVGVSSAIALGGPGAVFWCWLTGFLGMATAYAECYLSMSYRNKETNGSWKGGMMYVWESALHNKKAGKLFAFLLLIASFGIGCSTQAGTVTESVSLLTGTSPVITGLLLVFAVGYVILHGSGSIKKICGILVPSMAICYIVACLFLLLLNREFLLPSLKLILSSAFTPTAALGGIAGGSFLFSARYGIARGLFTNEAGLGTAPLAFTDEEENSSTSATKKSSAENSALLSMSAVFFDTVILCALTGIVILSALLRHPGIAAMYSPTTLTNAAFALLPGGETFLSLSLTAFAFATLVGWSHFGAQAASYLFGETSLNTYRICYLGMIYAGSVLSLPLIWEMTDFINACMVIPNVLALLLLYRHIKPPTN